MCYSEFDGILDCSDIGGIVITSIAFITTSHLPGA